MKVAKTVYKVLCYGKAYYYVRFYIKWLLNAMSHNNGQYSFSFSWVEVVKVQRKIDN